MKVKFLIVLLLLIAAALFVYSLVDRPVADDTEEIANTESEEKININDGFENSRTTEIYDSSDNYLITGNYAPEGVAGSVFVNNEISKYISEFKDFANESVPEIRDLESAVGRYTLNVVYESHGSGAYLFHVVSFGEYTGGASTNAIVYTYGFDLNSGQQVSINDFVNPEREEEFMSELRKRLLEIDSLHGNTVGVFEDVVSELTFGDLRTFYIEGNKIVIVFSKYEVAPGAAGIFEVKLDNIYRESLNEEN